MVHDIVQFINVVDLWRGEEITSIVVSRLNFSVEDISVGVWQHSTIDRV